MRVRSSLLLLPLVLFLAGCPPEAGPTGGGGPTTPQGPAGSGSGDPPAPPPPQQGQGGDGGSAPWQLIPQQTLTEVAWPMLDPVATWPSPDSLVPPQLAAGARAVDPAEVRALTEVVERVVKPTLRPTDPQAAIGLDDQGRLFMKLGRGKAEGSASLATHPADRPPTFAFALATAHAAATTIEQLRQQLAQVVSPELAAELAREQHRLEPHPKGTPGVGLAFLDRHGFGERFPYLYAFSGDKRLLVILHEVPHLSLDAKAEPTPR